ncbi:GIY-YIG nuclease family protein [Priestia aryabhattai]|uniref:GIY-YIG nuclease family protein n=1 Tax=Priestia aryabhattai TaxID=412384 RepID=A0AAX6NCR3_PRIAR|nr:GIY-YIG nuclease family protein [Priestia aryabhattai]MDU9693701.1 GIY-YIG nuclease family protein [Priestia aryabhattai]
MSFLNKLFGNKKQENQPVNQDEKKELLEQRKEDELAGDTNESEELESTISLESLGDLITFSSGPVGVTTGSAATDFYVYEWFIKETGEVFYVGKGRGNRYKAHHERAYEAEKIREMYDTDVRFVKKGLTEEEAVELESQEMTRILNETNDRLTNRMIPFFTKRGNGYDRSSNTPSFQFETAPTLYVNEIEEHYYNLKPQLFDEVILESLKAPVFMNWNIDDQVNTIYGGNVEKYLGETKSLLLKNGSKVLKSQYAKSTTAWIYVGDESVTKYNLFQKNALDRIGRKIPTYHLIDVWRFLKDNIDEFPPFPLINELTNLNPTHNRVPLEGIKNLYDVSKGFDEGMPYWQEGDKERKNGNLERAIELFDLARYNGYEAPALYKSYTMAFRKLKDYDNEIAIIDEAIERSQTTDGGVNESFILEIKERREKAILLKKKKEGIN